MKDEIQKILNGDITGHPSRKEQQKIKRLEKIVLILAEALDRIQQSGPIIYGPGIVPDTRTLVCTGPCVYPDIGDGDCVNCGQPKIIKS